MSVSATATDRSPTSVGAAKTPWGTPGVGVLGVILALLVIALGGVGIRDFLVYRSWVSGSPWLAGLANQLHSTRADGGVVFWGVVAAVIGIVLLGFGFGRRPRPGYRLSGEVPLYLTPRDVARIASGAARDIDGVLQARSRATRRKLEVTVTTTAGGANPEIDDLVNRTVLEHVAALDRPPRVTVTAREVRP